MALLHNTVIQSAMLGLRLTGIEPQLPLSPLNRAGGKNFYTGGHSPNKTSGMPNGHVHPSSWKMPMQSGGLSCYTTVTGSGAVSATGQAGLNMDATLTGSGDISSALASLIVSMAASISGSGTISSADARAFLDMVATITGSGSISAAPLTGLGELAASLTGSGTATGSTLTGTGAMSATIRGYGDLTPEGIRDAVWNALAASYNTSGTMGAKLNTASSGGVDLNALVTSASMGELLKNVPDNVWNKTLP